MKKLLIPALLIILASSCKKDDSTPAPVPDFSGPSGTVRIFSPELEQPISRINAHLEWSPIPKTTLYSVLVWYYNSIGNTIPVVYAKYPKPPAIITFGDSLIGKKVYWTIMPLNDNGSGVISPTSSFYVTK